MNNFELRCYRETYKNLSYWEGERFKNESLRHQRWQECRQVTDQFYDELVFRGYLILRHSSH